MQYPSEQNLFLLHGNKTEITWQNALLSDVSGFLDKGLVAVFPKGPVMDSAERNIKQWYKELDRYASKNLINENTTMTAYSTGSIAAANFIADTGLRIKTLATVAGFTGNIRKQNITNFVQQILFKYYYGYKVTEKTLAKVSALVPNIHAFLSSGDYRIADKELYRFANGLGAQIHICSGQGHFNQKNNVTRVQGLSEVIHASIKTPAGKRFSI